MPRFTKKTRKTPTNQTIGSLEWQTLTVAKHLHEVSCNVLRLHREAVNQRAPGLKYTEEALRPGKTRRTAKSHFGDRWEKPSF